MHARSWFVLTAVCTLVCTSGCGSARWGNRHSRLRMPSPCVESSCDDPTCEICSPLPPLYDGMARNHRLNRRAGRGHGHGQGRHNFGGGCSCGQCGDGEWFEGEIIDGEVIGGDCFGGCSSCMSCGDGMMMDGMSMGMSSGCSSCQQHSMMDSSMQQSAMMSGQTYEMQEQQPTLAAPQRSAVPSGGPVSPAPKSTVPGDLNPGPMGSPMGSPMGTPANTPETPPMSMRMPNYGAALFGAAPAEPRPYVPASATQPMMQEQAIPAGEVIESPMSVPPAPPLASPAAHSQPMLMTPPSMPTFPIEQQATPQPSEYYSPKESPYQGAAMQPNPIQLQSATVPAATPGKKAMRPFSEAAKPKPKMTAQAEASPPPATPAPVLATTPTPKRPQGQPMWEGSLKMQPVQQASAELPALPKR